MRVAIVAHNLHVAGGLSVGRNVLAALAEVAPQHDYLLVLPRGVGYEDAALPPSVEVSWQPRRGVIHEGVFRALRLPRLVAGFAPDVVWCLGNFGLVRPPAPQALVLQNAHYVYDADWGAADSLRFRIKNRLMRTALARALPRTGLVFCQTETMARRFRERFGFGGRLELLPNAVSRFAARGGVPPAAYKRLAGRFTMLCLSKYYAHKNLEVLLEVFARHRDALADCTVITTVAPDQHPRAAGFLDRIRTAGLERYVLNVGPIPQPEIGPYFEHAGALLFPTMLESFSATYLEAMHFRLPIMTSDRDFAREICGPAALYFDPRDPAAIAAAIRRVRDQPELRAELVAAGELQLAQRPRAWNDIVRQAVHQLEALSGPSGTGTT